MPARTNRERRAEAWRGHSVRGARENEGENDEGENDEGEDDEGENDEGENDEGENDEQVEAEVVRRAGHFVTFFRATGSCNPLSGRLLRGWAPKWVFFSVRPPRPSQHLGGPRGSAECDMPSKQLPLSPLMGDRCSLSPKAPK